MKRVLFVDDDPAILETLAELFAETYEVATAADGEDAMRLLSRERFDAVVLDLMMPVLDGPGVKRELDRLGIRVPVVVMSAGGQVRSVARAMGADAYVKKPFGVDELSAALASVLDRGGGGGGTPASGEGAGGHAESADAGDGDTAGDDRERDDRERDDREGNDTSAAPRRSYTALRRSRGARVRSGA